MTSEEIRLDIAGMTCSSCVSSVENIISKHQEVTSVSVNLTLNKASIGLQQGAADNSVDQIISAIEKGGFKASVPKKEISIIDSAKLEVRKQGKKATIAILLAIPVLWLSMFASDLGNIGSFDLRLCLAMLATMPVYFWSGWSFHSKAWSSLKNGSTNMDVLIHLSTTVAFLWSTAVTIATGIDGFPNLLVDAEHVFFDGVSFIIAFVLIGNYLEAAAKLRATDAVYSLMQLQPNDARLIIEGDYTEVKSIELIPVNSLIKVLAGETIPIDGVLQDCKASIDESTMTGEAYPVRRSDGDEVLAGTIVLDGTIIIKTTKIAQDCLLSNVIKLVEDAQMGKAPIQRLVDKIASVFVPSVVVLALAASLFWGFIGADLIDNPMNSKIELSIMILISTLVIACPCALGLATPTALVVGTGVGARNGLLIKGIDALEIAHKCDTLVVDKTGTITSGKPRVSHIEIIDCEVKEILSIASSLESESNHPLASAIHTSWSNVTSQRPQILDITTIAGMGLVGKLDGQVVAIGNRDLLEDVGVVFSDEVEERIELASRKGVTMALVSRAERLLGWIEAKDRIRESSETAIKKAKEMGFEVIMLTGDNQSSAEVIAEKVGIKKVISGVKPDQKAQYIKSLQEQNKIVAMVGDGINDAAALSQADIGLAMGAGSDIALDTADFVLIRNDLIDAVSSLDLGRATMRRIRTNLGWAFIYNLIGIPLAMGILLPINGLLLPPAFAAAAMSLSSVSVVSNSLVLRWWKPIQE